LDKRWRKWKGLWPLRRRRLETVQEEKEEEEDLGGKIEEWNEEDEMGR